MDVKTWKVNKQATQLPYFDDMLMPLMIIIYRRHGVEYQHLGKWLIRYLKLQDIQAKLEANNSLDFTFNQVIKDLTDIGICYIIYSKLVEYSLRGFSPE